MKEYKTVLQNSVQKLGGRVNSLYSRYAPSLGELLMSGYTAPKNRDPYYNRKTRRHGNSDYGKFTIPAGTGYPELKPVGSYI